VKTGASLYVCHPSSWQREFQNALEGAGFSVRCQIIWGHEYFRAPRDPMGPFRMLGVRDCARIAVLLGYRWSCGVQRSCL
jgi:hypothetical protein